MGNKNSKNQGGFGAISKGLDPSKNGFNRILDPRKNGTSAAFNRSLENTRKGWNASLAKTNRDLDFAFNNKVKSGLNYWFVEGSKYNLNIVSKNLGFKQPFEGQRPAGFAGLLSARDRERWNQTITFGSFFSGVAGVSSVIAPYIPVIGGEAPPFTVPGVGEVDLGGLILGGIGGGGISGGEAEQNEHTQVPTNTDEQKAPGMTSQERLGYAVMGVGGVIIVYHLLFKK